jgi:hypothetical protein
MIEKTVIDYLDSVLPVSAYAEMPQPRPESFCLVQQTGGGARNRLKTAVVAVQSYGGSRYAAGVLCDTVIEAMDGLSALPEIAGCRLNAAYPFPDTDEKKYRFQAVFDITYY